MKNVKILELTLENFKGQNRKVTFGETENRCSGRNGSGKTSLMKAWYWLVSSYSDAHTAPNSNLFDNRVELSKDTPKASVTAVVSIDGETYKLTKTAEAKYTRKRGTDSYEKASSDSYEMFIDDIQRNSGDWKSWLDEHIAPEDMLKFCLSGEFFVEKCFSDKKSARQIIERLVGTVTREEMRGDYSAIDDLLKRYDLNEIDQRAQNLIKGIDARLNEIPALIQSKESEIAEIEQVNFAQVENNIKQHEQELSDLDKQMTDLSERIKPQMEAKHKAEQDQQMKKDVMEKAYEDWKKSFDTRRQKLTDEIAAIRQQNAKSEKARSDEEARRKMLSQDIKNDENILELAKQKRERLLAERDAEKAKTLDPSATICPHCGAELQGEKLQGVIDNFERVKRERIEKIVHEGKITASEIEILQKNIAEMQKKLEEPLPQVITQPTDELEKQVLELANTNTSKIAFLETEQGKALLDDLGSVVIPEVVMPDNSEIVAKKKEVNDKLVPLYERRGLKNRLTMLRKAVDELRVEQKEKGALLAQYELQSQTVKAYKQEQMEILSRKVNDGLKCSRIDVWSQQKSGEMVPDLVLKDENGVSYSTTNTASRIRVTADIQRFFCNRLAVNMPCWVDEVSVLNDVNLPKFDAQMFYLSCSETGLTVTSK